ncbi:ABC transporter ATP-binding protein [Luteimicrobium subarcticum]|uniref:ABC-2 type transport system ATP-binding protein n=1 Tax=Luteimicrobium subarcticum TaxID=620910 RepID=A0A2M8W6N4_9MICO|nr:ABC transporter ATP-binding protein [Luteimicrobium subarcticum]PJI86591.1 ABC-2 type transport system ATP-binding protein [Luteimicrobium subarcticum]
MTSALTARGLTKRYGRRTALAECTLEIPAGRVVALVGPNGAGKSTLLNLAAGLIRPTSGEIEVLGDTPACSPDQLARVGFVAQDAPTYAGLTVADHLELGRRLNPRWDHRLAERRIDDLALDPRQKAGRLSGGQRAQLALTLALAKRPELLLLDEPAASLDPLARRELLQGLMTHVVDHGASVVLSSHLVSDLERVCDHVVVLTGSHVQLAADLDEVTGTHYRLTGDARDLDELPPGAELVHSTGTDRHRTVVVRSALPVVGDRTQVEPLGMEDVVLAYMARAASPAPRPDSPAEAVR